MKQMIFIETNDVGAEFIEETIRGGSLSFLKKTDYYKHRGKCVFNFNRLDFSPQTTEYLEKELKPLLALVSCGEFKFEYVNY